MGTIMIHSNFTTIFLFCVSRNGYIENDKTVITFVARQLFIRRNLGTD